MPLKRFGEKCNIVSVTKEPDGAGGFSEIYIITPEDSFLAAFAPENSNAAESESGGRLDSAPSYTIFLPKSANPGYNGILRREKTGEYLRITGVVETPDSSSLDLCRCSGVVIDIGF